jgi:shikimate dehydrogenase
VDLPIGPDLPEDLWGLDRSRLLLSWHAPDDTPGNLRARLGSMREWHPAVCKVVSTAHDFGDLLAVRDLLRAEGGRRDLCAFAMGTPGIASRALALAWGSCATYASAPGSPPAAPGQMGLAELLEVYRPREARVEEPLYAVVGWPLHRTGSPALHNRWLHGLGLPGRFVPLPARDFEAFLRRAGELPLVGIAVTVPHKVHALDGAVRTSRLARRVGACNTLLPVAGGWLGANTDVFGILTALARVPRGASSLLLGAGGAARAAAVALSMRGPFAVTARDGSKARDLARAFGAHPVPWEERGHFPCDLLVNATPCGQVEEESPYPLQELRAPWVFDMVVREGGTPLLRAARAKELGTISGEAMLEAQARLQFRLFTGHRAPR